jgi:Methyltransferase domain
MVAAPLPQRLAFRMPQFARLAWVTPGAKDVWEPRLVRIAAAWEHCEFESVGAATRRCGMRLLADDEILSVTASFADRGIIVSPIYADRRRARVACVAGRANDVAQFVTAWRRGDNDAIGQLLGYPECCRACFSNIYGREKWQDPTVSIALGVARSVDATSFEVVGSPACNVFLRAVGVRAVPHLPCHFSCDASTELAARFADLARQLGHEEEIRWTIDILSWPLEWSALHGIAEVKTPVFKLTTHTDATAERYVVRWTTPDGQYPPEGASGRVFPYRPPTRPPIPASLGFRRGLAEKIRQSSGENSRASPVDNLATSEFADNGFMTRAAMQRSHDALIGLLRKANCKFASHVIDLGCGNGVLVGRIYAELSCAGLAGVDVDPRKIEAARRRFPTFATEFVAANIFDVAVWRRRNHYSLAVLALTRLSEVAPEQASLLIRSLKACCAHVLAYDYEAWEGSSLPSKMRRFGLEPSTISEPFAALVSWPRSGDSDG